MGSNGEATSEKRARLLSDLELLAHFLNFDFRTGDVQELKEVFRSSLVFEKFPAQRKARQIQSKLKRDLLPIIGASEMPEPMEAYGLLERLVQKINRKGLKREWAVLPVDYEFVNASYIDPQTGKWGGKEVDLEKVGRAEAQQKLRDYLAPGQRPLELFSTRWIVSERASLIHSRGLENYLYWKVIQALERGRLSDLRRCRQCNNWFVQKDPRKGFCSSNCKYKFHNKRRLAEGYFRELRHKRQERALRRARSLLKEGKSPQKVSETTGLSLRILRREGLID